MATFDKKWFNPLYFILNEIIKVPSIRTVLIYGGKSSSKTISICQQFSKEAYVKNSNTIAYRKEGAIIDTTLKKSFNLAIDSMYLNPAVEKYRRSYVFQTESEDEAEIIMKGLDDPEKAKGIESYKYVYLDELNHFEYEEYEQFDLSLRGIPGQKLFGSWNPVDENSWVKTRLVDLYTFEDTDRFGTLPCADSFVRISSDGKVVLIKTTYEDNFWVVGSPCGTYGYRDENLISLYEGMLTKNYNSYKVNVKGEWGKTTYGGEFLKQWRSEVHVGSFTYNPKCAVYLIFDENVNPYFPCGIFQIGEDGKHPTLLHELAMKNPVNTVRHICAEISRKLTEWGHKEAVFIGGDATSKKDDVKQEKGHNFFELIRKELLHFNPRMAILTSNPSVRMSADFFNSILESEYDNIIFRVNKSCRTAITDYEYTKEDKNGKVDKSPVTDPVTKVSYQPYGHFVDLTRYFLCYVFAASYARYQSGPTVMPTVGKSSPSRNSY